jgi:hypothetical protein
MDWRGMNESDRGNNRSVCMYMMSGGDKKGAFAFSEGHYLITGNGAMA